MKILLFGALLFWFMEPVYTFWWWFSSEIVENENFSREDSSIQTVKSVFAPFEISIVEQKFLQEANTYLSNLPMLDQCNLLIINRLKASCSQLSDEELSKLSVNLLNCQSAVEGRTIFKCTDEMKLADCTKNMDSDTWNAYHIISNRARSICYSMRQTEFRMQTEKTVNHLANAALENVNMLKNLAAGQKELQASTDQSMKKISGNQEKVIEQQDELKSQQRLMGSAINQNMHHLLQEKRLIASRHRQVEEYTHMINEQLASLITEIKTQEDKKKKEEKEILKDLDVVKEKANEVLLKLESAFVDVDNYHENIESKQNKTLENLQEIQEAIVFMNQVLSKLYASFHEQLPWIHELFGGTIDKLTAITYLLGHSAFFVLACFGVLFVNAPRFTRVLLLFIVPLNCFTALHECRHLSYTQISWLLALSVPVNYVLAHIYGYIRKFLTCQQVVPNSSQFIELSSPNPLKAARDLRETIDEIASIDSLPTEQRFSTPCKEESCQQPEYVLFKCTPTATPVGKLNYELNESPSLKRRTPTAKNKSFSILETTVGGSIKCSAYTKSGSRCKNPAQHCMETCRVHTPQK